MLIKCHPNKNDYCLSKSGHWVRDFTKKTVQPHDINDLMTLDDIKLMVENEFKNSLRKYQTFENDISHEKAVIIGDGYGFDTNIKLIESLPQDVITIGVNGAFARWNSNRRLNYYIVNNPYQECLYYYPQVIRIWPKCIASARTNPQFLEAYKGLLYLYTPTLSENFTGITKESLLIDDYRNPICAAIILCYKFGIKKLLFMSTLEMYEGERPGAQMAKNNLWVYPQQKLAHDLVDANLYWMQKVKTDVAYTGDDLDYEFASYISSDDLKGFFNERRK